MNKNYKYVDEKGQVVVGATAQKILESTSDEKYLSDDGVAQVSKERWEEAQRYELSEWVERASHFTDDRNFFHKDRFDNYMSLKGHPNVTSFIELGCGPFTNARVILDRFPNIEKITLLDPLAEKYQQQHPHCQYKDSSIRIGFDSHDVEVISSPIEEFTTSQKYDIVVMINVLEHCYDIPAIFNKIDEILAPEGLFVYADVQFNLEDIKQLTESTYNAGHPIRLTKEYVNNVLDTNYTQLFSQTFTEMVAGYEGEERYFIGKKK